MPFLSLLLAWSQPVYAPPPPPPQVPTGYARTLNWPTARPGRIVASPDWGDYQIYPPEARALQQEGRVVSRLLVDAAGTTIDCQVVVSSGHAELDQGTCARMLEVRFEPGKNEGRPVASSRLVRVHWRLTDEHQLTRSSVVARLTLRNAVRSDCAIAVEGPHFRHYERVGCLPLNPNNNLLTAFPSIAKARLEVEIAPAGEPMSKPRGRPIVRRLISFSVDAEGDPVACRTVSEEGRVALLAPQSDRCDHVLRSVWFAAPASGQAVTGQYEVRMYAGW